MEFSHIAKRVAVAGALALVLALYLANLTGMGMIGPDEPRYAAIGRAMAASGDWVTPRLWGQPWFEKPALLYWMTAVAFRMGAGPDLAPRLPVALCSVVFLAFFWWRLRREWDARVASYSAAILATSGGWLAYSHVAVTDLPLAALFSAAVLLSIPWLARNDRRGLTAAGACLGLAVLTKGLVPLVLFMPVAGMGWRRARDWLRPGPLLAFSVCCLPWYTLCTLRNGSEFPRVFFLQHQFGRFSSAALQHVQPWWFYIPASMLLFYPWFPLLCFAGRWARDARIRMLAFVVIFGFVFFSLAVNKLPSYVLPLLPAASVLAGYVLASGARPGIVVAPLLLLGLLPAMSRVVPEALVHGIRSASIPWETLAGGAAGGALIAVVLTAAARTRIFAIVLTIAAIGFLSFQFATFPALDDAASARKLWTSKPGCAPPLPRSLLYGLDYYAERELPECTVLDRNSTRAVP